MDGLEDGRPQGLRRRLLFAIARVNEDKVRVAVVWMLINTLLLAWLSPKNLVVLVAIVVLLGMVTAVLVLIQLSLGAVSSDTAAYVVHLAFLGGRGRTLELGKVKVKVGPGPSYWWEIHKTAMKRLGDSLTPGSPYRAMLTSLSETTWSEPTRPASIDEVLTAIDLALLEQAYQLPEEKGREPFLSYARELDAQFSQPPAAFESWRRFPISKYELVAARLRSVAKVPALPEPRVTLIWKYVRERWPELIFAAILSLVGLAR